MQTKLTMTLMILSLATLPLLSVPAAAPAQGIQMADSVSMMADVVAIDKATRAVTLRGPEGNDVTIKVPPTDPHFDEVAAGDKVRVTYQQSVALYLDKAGDKPETTAESSVATSPKGAQPKAVIAEAVDVSAKVLAIDREKRTLTLEMADGRKVATRVDESLPGFENVKVGDLIHARITEAVALSLEKQ